MYEKLVTRVDFNRPKKLIIQFHKLSLGKITDETISNSFAEIVSLNFQ